MESSQGRKNISGYFTSTVTSPMPTHIQTPNSTDEGVLIVFEHYINTIVLTLLCPVGVTANILNIIVFCKQGIRKTINITFLALSFWDLLNCLFSGLSKIFIALGEFCPLPAVNTISVQYVYIGYTRGCVYILSTLVTVYLSVERCICIILPHKVKGIFTTPRVSLINFIIIIFGLVCFCPAWATQGLQWVLDPRTNRTRLDLWVSVNRRRVDLFVDTFNGIVIPALAQLLITVSGVFMIQSIHKSIKFRQKEANISKPSKLFNVSKEFNKTTNTQFSVGKANMLKSKDVRVTKVVVLLATIFFACNLPVFLVAILRAVIPDLDVGKPLFSLYKVLYGMVYCCGVINSTVNICVYYKVSTKYKKTFVALFCRNHVRNTVI